jgi:uncharacterized protein (TIGR02996 family)
MSVVDHMVRWMEVSAIEQRLRERPGDLDAWLVYGDRLVERGDARGAVIRLEHRRARVGPADRDALERELAALVKEHQQSWDAELPPGVTALERRYGFATKVAVEWSDDAPVAIEQALRGPFVTALRVKPDEDDGEVEDYDEDGVPIPPPLIDAGALATLDLSGLTELDLSYLPIGALGARALAVSAYLRVEAAEIQALAASAAAGRIETLDVRYGRIGDEGLAALAGSASFGGVRRLHLQHNELTAKGMHALHRFAGPAELDLRYNEIGPEGVETLLAAPFIGSLRRLRLNRSDVGEAGVKSLANASRLPPALRSYWRSV